MNRTLRAQLRLGLMVAALPFAMGCSALNALPPVVSDHDSAQPVDDAAMRKQLLAGARLAYETGKTTPMATLITQLRRPLHVLPTPLPTASPWQLDGPALAKRMRAAVVVVGDLHNCGKCSKWHVGAASGFFVSASGLVVTNYHVVAKPGSATLVVMQADGTVLPVLEVVAADQAQDLAVLRVDTGDYPTLPLAKIPPAGRRVMVLSHPGGRFYSLTSGVVSRLFRGLRSGRVVQLLQVDAAFAKGSSGAPIVDASGAVVGVARATQTVVHDSGATQMVVGHATPAAAIRLLLTPKRAR